MPLITKRAVAAIFWGLLLLLCSSAGFAGEGSGVDDYQRYCARCHGYDGKGNGPDAKTLHGYRPTDLTLIRKNNHGEFPRQELYDVIDGGKRVPGHSNWNSPMPLWGLHFQEPGKEYSQESEAQVKNRISSLIDYIVSIQENQ